VTDHGEATSHRHTNITADIPKFRSLLAHSTAIFTLAYCPAQPATPGHQCIPLFSEIHCPLAQIKALTGDLTGLPNIHPASDRTGGKKQNGTACRSRKQTRK